MLFKKKRKKEDDVIDASSALYFYRLSADEAINMIQNYTKRAYDRSFYAPDGPAKKFKAEQFKKGPVYDPYTGNELFSSKSEAMAKYGDDYNKHVLHVDHIEPVDRMVAKYKNTRYLTEKDLQRIINTPSNFQSTSGSVNQSKNDLTQREWSKNTPKMQEYANDSGRSVNEVKKQVINVGDEAALKNNINVRKAQIKNAAKDYGGVFKDASILVGTQSLIANSIEGFKRLNAGDATFSEVAKDTAKNVVSDAAKGGASAAMQTAVKYHLQTSGKEVLQKLGKGNTVGNAAILISYASKYVPEVLNGERSTAELAEMAGRDGVAFIGSAAAVFLATTVSGGSVVIVPLASYAGGTVLTKAYDSLLSKIKGPSEEDERRTQESTDMFMRKYLEEQRLKQIQFRMQVEITVNSAVDIMMSPEFKYMIQSIKSFFSDVTEIEREIADLTVITMQLAELREQYKEFISKYYKGYEEYFEPILDSMDDAFRLGNYNKAIMETNKISEAYGAKSNVNSVDDFWKIVSQHQNN